MTVVDRNLKILKLGTQTNCLNLQANSNNTKKKKTNSTWPQLPVKLIHSKPPQSSLGLFPYRVLRRYYKPTENQFLPNNMPVCSQILHDTRISMACWV